MLGTTIWRHAALAALSAALLTIFAFPGGSRAEERWPDPLLTTTASPQNVARGLEIDAHQLGISASVWGYPLVRMERVAREYTDVPDPKPATS